MINNNLIQYRELIHNFYVITILTHLLCLYYTYYNYINFFTWGNLYYSESAFTEQRLHMQLPWKTLPLINWQNSPDWLTISLFCVWIGFVSKHCNIISASPLFELQTSLTIHHTEQLHLVVCVSKPMEYYYQSIIQWAIGLREDWWQYLTVTESKDLW